ncbi:MAG: hydroxyacylglutathione hydrolase [Pseudomonadota bacterium]|jgi:hydroxyacylglutathione hydrolase
MPHVVSVPPAPYRAKSGRFEVHIVPAAEDNLSFILVCSQTREAAVVDGPDAEVVLDYAAEHDLQLRMVLNTHTHGDHVGLNRGLQRALGAELAIIGPAVVAQAVPCLTRGVDEGDEIALGALRIQVLRTDGHLFGHLSFLLEEALFCGDTMFTGGSGRVFSGDYPAMQASLAKLRALSGDTRIFCAHEYTSDCLAFALSVEPDNPALQERAARTARVRAQGKTLVPGLLSEEQDTNPMLRWDAPRLLAGLDRAYAGARVLSTPAEVYRAVRELKDSGRYRQP